MAFSRPVIGQATIKLTKPANQETVNQLRDNAYKSFKTDLWEWMKEEADVTVDTSNTIQRYHFQAFADSCFSRLESKPLRSGYDMSITFAIPGEDARALLEAYNTRCYGISLRYYTIMKTALENNAVNDLFNAGIQTIFYTMGRMGTPIDMPDESTPRSFLLEDSRKIMQNFFNKFTVRAQDVLINGKAGTMLANPLTVTVLIDTVPLTDITLIGTLPNGSTLCTSKSGSDGVVAFTKFKIPFVARGTMLYFKPDVSMMLPGVPRFEAHDLGLMLPEQTLVFNVVPPSYSLTYKVNSANSIPIPKDFASDAYVKKYLKDSCYLAPVAPAQQPDLYISITTQISSYSHDETEQTVRKVENDIEISDSEKKSLVKKQAVAFEKAYENATAVPEGLFFWEAAGKSLHMIKALISGM